jgi:glutaconate CoA-transferase subunit A
MTEEAHSPIKEISKVKYREREFEWWGLSPEDARKAKISKPRELSDKRTTLKEAVSEFIKDGSNIALGGFVNVRAPIATVHEVIRQGAKDLTLSFHSQSMAAELLGGAMILNSEHLSVKRAELAAVGYEMAGLAPIFAYLITNGLIEMDDYTNYGMAARFKAGAMGIPFMPVRDHGGSDMELVNRGKFIECPFSGENIYVVPACHPDVALIHVQAADKYGNCRIFGPLMACPEIALAATHTIITTEEIITDESIRSYPNLTEIPFLAVDAVVHQPLGGFPGAVYGFYWFLQKHLEDFRNICEEFRVTGNKKKLEDYYDKYIYQPEAFDDFIKAFDRKELNTIKELDGGQTVIL